MDPRSSIEVADDIRPVVGSVGGKTPVWLMAAGLGLGAVLLFTVLDGRRRERAAPTTTANASDLGQSVQSLPGLYILPEPSPPAPPTLDITASEPPSLPLPQTVTPSAPMPPPPSYAPFSPQPPPPSFVAPQPFQSQAAQPVQAGQSSSSSALVIDTTRSSERRADMAADGSAPPGNPQTAAVRWSRLNRTANTVPQGTLIPAVLETALDSTRPGSARAIVSRDISGFSGSLVLIPKGSRLFGEYQADVSAGQNRAFIQWSRLVRPDGVTIALASPAADLEGRAGVRGRVDNHFLERFGSALVQTTLNIGTSIAARSIGGDNGVVVALPGSTQNVGGSATDSRVQPTLRVAAVTDAPSTGQVYLHTYLVPLQAVLDRTDVTDIYVNRPGEIWVESLGGRAECLAAPALTEQVLERLARQIAAFSHQGVNREHPILSASLPSGERVQIVLPPATRGAVALAIRKQISADLGLDDYQASGAFDQLSALGDANHALEERLRQHLHSGEIGALLKKAVSARRNILVSGGTSSGKTTFLNALIREIPQTERLILIEDTPELHLRHPNGIGLIAARGALGEASVSTEDLLSASLRMRPDRIILGELRGPEAYTFLRSVNTGHPGSMTTIHADSPERAIEQLALLVLQGGTRLNRSDVFHYVRSSIDIFVQLDRGQGQRRVSEIRLREPAL
ncbi:hypothetical protein LTR94_024050 [Friedmanniomyces endolithicus]|nr:hypothetical protein LTR94_024050 [Friedmanniomyces endolithicus]